MAKRYAFYLVGTTWYSASQGDYPNTDTFPSFHTFSAEEAERKYEEYRRRDRDGSTMFEHAYLLGALPDGKFEFIKGKTNPLEF